MRGTIFFAYLVFLLVMGLSFKGVHHKGTGFSEISKTENTHNHHGVCLKNDAVDVEEEYFTDEDVEDNRVNNNVLLKRYRLFTRSYTAFPDLIHLNHYGRVIAPIATDFESPDLFIAQRNLRI